MSVLRVRVLGPIGAELDGSAVRLSKPRHREILGILVAARGGRVSTARLVDELWEEAPAGAVGAVRTFVGELRKILEPGRPARTPPAVILTVADGYAVALDPDAVDLWRAERLIRDAAMAGPAPAAALLASALNEWRGGAFEEFSERPWAKPERASAAAARAGAVESLAEAELALGRPAQAAALLEQHIAEHPWREAGWRLLAAALYRSERQGEALAVLRRARAYLAGSLGLDPGPRLDALERGILRGDPSLMTDAAPVPDAATVTATVSDATSAPDGSILMRAANAHSRSGPRAQLESASALLPGLAVAGGVGEAGEQRLATIRAAREFGDPELSARIIGGFDVPGVWTRSDDPTRSAAIVAAARQAITELPSGAPGRSRARLLATIAMESRGTVDGGAEAEEAEQIARRIGDPQLLCFALSARAIQAFETTGLAARRADIAAEIIAAAVDAELATFEIHGRLVRMQALCALGDLASAAGEADAVDALADRHERPLARVFTAWFRHTFVPGTTTPPPDGAEMPGFAGGIAALADVAEAVTAGRTLPERDVGPYEPWVRPLRLAAAGQSGAAIDAIATAPDPDRGLLAEALWSLVARAAIAAGDRAGALRAEAALLPAAAEVAAGSAVIDLGPIAETLAALAPLTRTV